MDDLVVQHMIEYIDIGYVVCASPHKEPTLSNVTLFTVTTENDVLIVQLLIEST